MTRIEVHKYAKLGDAENYSYIDVPNDEVYEQTVLINHGFRQYILKFPKLYSDEVTVISLPNKIPITIELWEG